MKHILPFLCPFCHRIILVGNQACHRSDQCPQAADIHPCNEQVISVGKFRKLMPEVQRGILAMHFTQKKTHRSLKNYLAEMLVFNRIASPDFVAFCHSDASFASFKLVRGVWDAYTVAWTVRSKEEEEAAIKNGFDSVIFENYIPE